jgi:hypothetical protein
LLRAAQFVLAFACCTPALAFGAERLVIFDFRGVGANEVRAEMTRVARATALNRTTGRLDLIDPDTIDLVSRGTTFSKCTGDECEVELAGALGASFAMVGFVKPTPSGLVLDVKVFDVRSARPLVWESTTGASDLVLLSSTAALVTKALDSTFARLDTESAVKRDVARKSEWDRDRAARESRRTIGWWMAGAGAVLAASAGAFAYLGAQENQTVRNGGLATAADIDKAIQTGKTYNTLGYGAGAAGVLLLGVGAGVLLWNRDPGEFRPTLAVAPGGVVIAGVRGTLP